MEKKNRRHNTFKLFLKKSNQVVLTLRDKMPLPNEK